MQKKLYQDLFGDVIDPAHLSEPVFANTNGTVVESGGKITYSIIYSGGAKRKDVRTLNQWNDGEWIIDVSNADNSYVYLQLNASSAGDYTNCADIRYNRASARFRFYIRSGGVSHYIAGLVSGALTAYKMKLTRVGNTISAFVYYGGSWRACGSSGAYAIGANLYLYLTGYSHDSHGGAKTFDLNELLITGTGVYWDTKGDGSAIKDTYNQQVLADGPGATITFGTAVFIEGPNMIYDYKIGSGAWVTGRTSAQIIALGDVVCDTGVFDLRADYGGATSQASWTSLNVPTVSSGGYPGFINGVNANLLGTVIGTQIITGVR